MRRNACEKGRREEDEAEEAGEREEEGGGGGRCVVSMLLLAECGIDAEFAICVPEAAAGHRLTVADRRVASTLALAESGALAKAGFPMAQHASRSNKAKDTLRT